MRKIKLPGWAKKAIAETTKRSPEILLVLGIGLAVTATVTAVKATPKALKLISAKKRELGVEKLSIKETVKTTAKVYIPTTIATGASIACLVGSHGIVHKRNLVLAASAAAAENALEAFKDVAKEELTDTQIEKIEDKVFKKETKKNPQNKKNTEVTGYGAYLCYDMNTGSYFTSTREKILSAVNELNAMLLKNDEVTANDFYYLLGRDQTRDGDYMVWRSERGLVQVTITSRLREDGTPCLAIQYKTEPKYIYQ